MEDHELRSECATTFAKMGTIVEGFTKAVDEFRDSNKEIDRRVTTLENSNKTLWREVKDDVLPELKKLPKEVRKEFTAHKKDCPAYIKVMNRAIAGGSTSRIPAPTGREATTPFVVPQQIEVPKKGTLVPSPIVLKWILYIGLLIGGIVAGYGASLGGIGPDISQVSAP